MTRELATRFPLGTPIWGMNKSQWKRDHWYIHGEDEIRMEDVVRAVLPESSAIEVLTNNEGAELENAAAPRRYRDRPNKETS